MTTKKIAEQNAVNPNTTDQNTAPEKEPTNYIYMLRCSDGSLYTEWTNDLEKRIASHQSGRGAKYTKAHLPVELVYHETFATKEEAMRREWEIKQLTKAQKEELIKSADKKPDKIWGG